MIGNVKNLTSQKITSDQSKNAAMKVLVSPTEGWQGYVMRVVEVEDHGFTPKHAHPWPHINYILEGEGELEIAGQVTPVSPGSYAYVPSDATHQFRNTAETTFKFICIVPEEGHKL